MPAMMRLSVALILLLLLGLSAPASANPGPCLTMACLRAPDPNDPAGCRPVEFTGGEPRIQLKPFLNILNVDPSCLAAWAPI